MPRKYLYAGLVATFILSGLIAYFMLGFSPLPTLLIQVLLATVMAWGWIGFRVVIDYFITTFELAITITLWMWPLAILGLASAVNVFHQPFRLPLQDNVKDWFIVFIIICFVLDLMSVLASYVMKKKIMIMMNLTTGALWFGVIGIFFGVSYGKTGEFEYWTVIPWLASMVECIVGIIGGTQNAWNKNPAQIERDQ